jgi:hypothetical protein
VRSAAAFVPAVSNESSSAERPISNRTGGLAEASLRLKFGLPEQTVRKYLTEAFAVLLDLYGNSRFEVVTTANAVLEGPSAEGGKKTSYSMYYGQDFSADGERRNAFSSLSYVWSMGDIANLQTDYALVDFEQVFNKTFASTKVKVHSLCNLIYVIRKPLANYERDKKTHGRQQRLLF